MPTHRIHITGIVQGVGFRPFVYREAVARGLSGWVLNAGDGVHVEATGPVEALAGFERAMRADAPAAARVEAVEVEEVPARGDAGTGEDAGPAGSDIPAEPGASPAFRIVTSSDGTARTTLVSPDIATCPDCVRELFDPADRRFHYPFINCTNCGPRFTIIRELPYDRPRTSMDAFPMCPDCAAEYADPLDRRFHAQPDACFACGPHLTWRERGADAAAVCRTREESDAAIERCAELLAAGAIVAIKGLGGFHLACDAGSEKAVAELRQRKHRSGKPLAVMMRDLGEVRRVCEVNDAEEELLTGNVRPIVLLRLREPVGVGDRSPRLAATVANGLPELGAMLPYTPLQHLLMAACAEHGVRAVVMTSGNLSEEPIETDDALAWKRLVEGGIADALLGNDRAILTRYDDSVVRVAAGEPMPVRRARGYAPMPLPLPLPGTEAGVGAGVATGTADAPTAAAPAILACGSEQKATLALARGGQSFLSQHIGDVENAETLAAWHEARRRMEALFDIEPAALACDLHPGYLTSQWAREEAGARGLPFVEVQHHHAHIASVMAEAIGTGVLGRGEPVVGIALDGTGAGTDGTVWGGEVLICDLVGYARAAHLAPWRLPGGAASVRDARRNAFSLLMACDLLDHPGAAALLARMDEPCRTVTCRMVERGLNSPLASSAGRLLDALAALLGICDAATYEGEPAIRLEAAARRSMEADGAVSLARARAEGYELEVRCAEPAVDASACEARARVREREAGETLVLDPALLVRRTLDELASGTPTELIALRAQLGLAQGLARTAADIAAREGIRAVALSGGVFMNRLILGEMRTRLEAAGLTVLIPHSVPVNDGCIAYGQAAVARVTLEAGSDVTQSR